MIPGFLLSIEVIPLAGFYQKRHSTTPHILLGVTLTFSMLVTVLLVVLGLWFRKYHIAETRRIRVMEREK